MRIRFPEDELLNKIIPSSLLGNSLPIFNPETTLLILAIHHGAKDSWSYLRNVLDLCLVVKKHPNLDWDNVRRKARELGGIEAILLTGLKLGQQLFQLDLPLKIQRFNSQQKISLLTTNRIEKLKRPNPSNLDWGHRYLIQLVFFHLRARDKWTQCLGIIFSHIRLAFRPNERDFIYLPLPQGFRWFYLIIKPIRLIRKFISEHILPFETRKDLYNLYPLLVHLNLFGRSYLNSISSI